MTHPKHARADHDVLDVIRRRWSPRAYDPSRRVSRADLLRLFEAARWAPSSGNEQPWRFVVTDRVETPDTFAALTSSLTGRNPLWAANAPVLVLVAVRVAIERNESMNPHALYDAGQSVAFLTLQATSMGLSIRQMEGFDHEQARAACAVPAGFEPVITMAIGYAGDPSTLPHEPHRTAETTARIRRPVGEIVFTGTWGEPFTPPAP